MGEMKRFLEISKDAASRPMGSVSEIAVFVDDKAYRFGVGNSLSYNIRESLGLMGAPYDCYLASDYERVKDRYSAYIIIDPYRTALIDKIISDAEKREVPFLTVTPETAAITSEELRNFCLSSRVHIYTDTDAVIYVNESYLFVHAKGSVLPELHIPSGKRVSPLFEDSAASIKHPDFVSELYEFI